MKHCLVVDDSRVIRRVACRILAALAFETEEAADGESALQSCRRKMPDVILLDWQIPNMDGIEFLRTLRGEQGGNNPVVVFCTTENDLFQITEALGAGADDYIMKPFDRSIIESKLAEVGMV
jgi:two-component system chemotaxis response regulator CheY